MPIGVLHQISALVYSLEKFHFSCLLEGLESLYYEFVVISTVNIYLFKLVKNTIFCSFQHGKRCKSTSHLSRSCYKSQLSLSCTATLPIQSPPAASTADYVWSLCSSYLSAIHEQRSSTPRIITPSPTKRGVIKSLPTTEYSVLPTTITVEHRRFV